MTIKDYKNEKHELLTIEELYLWAKEQGLEKAGIGLSIYDERPLKERKEDEFGFEYCEEINTQDIETGDLYLGSRKVEDCSMIWIHNH